jgi:ribonucleotide monophosphatase NagD (HAD superfamily)
MCVGIEYATGKKPIFIGKPQPTMVLELMKKFGYTKAETVVVGDRLYTDIASGVNAGVDTVCVLCGEVTLKDVQNAKDGEKPTYVFAQTKQIVE